MIFGSIWDLIEAQRNRNGAPGYIESGEKTLHDAGKFWGWLVETYDVSAFVSGRILTYSHMQLNIHVD